MRWLAERLARLGMDNPVLLHLVFWVVCVAGVLSWMRMPKEEFPPVATDRILVVLPFPGASPEDVVEQLVIPVEDALEEVEGLSRVFVEATDNRATFTLELSRGSDVDATRDAVDAAVRGVEGLPEDMGTPRVRVAELRVTLAHVGLVGDPRQRRLADDLAAELAALPGVQGVEVQGAWERQIRVTLDPERAAPLGVDAAAAVAAVRGAGTGAPAGVVAVGAEGVLVRTPDGVSAPEDLARVRLLAGPGLDVALGDIATITEHFEPPTIRVRVNGQPAIDLLARAEPDADALAAVPRVFEWVDARRATLPEGLDLVPYDDAARLVQGRLAVLGSNAFVGLLLVAAVLALFIGPRHAALVVWGMPVAWLGGVAAMGALGLSVNVVSTFALLLVTGVIVDDAVVIVENVQRHLEAGRSRAEAALRGTIEVAPAVTAATVTTCLAFAPLLMLDGTVGRVMRIIPTVVILALLSSLFEAFFVLPGHLAHHAEDRAGRPEGAATRWVKRLYRPVLAGVVTARGRWVAALVCTALTAGLLGLGATLPRSLTTPGNPVFALINVDLPPSADPEATEAVVAGLERVIAQAGGEHVIYLAGRVGEQRAPQDLPTWGPRHGQVKVGFQNRPDAMAAVPGVLEAARGWLAARPEVVAVSVATLTGGPPSGKPIDLRVRAPDDDAIEAVVASMTAHLSARPGVRDVRTDAVPGSLRFEVEVDEAAARRLGLTVGEVARAVRGAVDGQLALEQSVGGRTAEVRVVWPEPASLDAVGDLPVRAPDGRMVRVRELATVRRVRGVERIGRVDGQRAVRVSAEVDARATSAEEERIALDAVLPAMLADHPGASVVAGGQLADAAESFRELPAAFLTAVMLIYAVLAAQFRSFLQPFIILAAVPLGLAGAFGGLFVLGMDLSLIALIGAVGLVGIVVNDALVLVDFVNQAREEGASLEEAVVQGSLLRLRPILITTVTTVLGLAPLGLGLAGAEPLLAPMAVSISFGLTFATALTLVVVPVLYLLVADLAGAWARLTAPRPDVGASGTG